MPARNDGPPNVLLLIWDACRYDFALEHARSLCELAASNVWFERAIAPSPWSLPSHASVFTGKHPHEHGCHRLDDPIHTNLLPELSELGYRTYGISANGFASQRTGFHEEFDEFYYTGGREVFNDGLTVSGYAQRHLEKDATIEAETVTSTMARIVGHEHPLKSAANLAAVGCGELANRYAALQRIPHPVFAPDSGYSYSPGRNTRVLESVLEAHEGGPFFVFMNYMDTHRPYRPPPALQEKHVGERLSYRELRRLNEEVAYPWEFIRKLRGDDLDERDVERVRGLYAGEVETVDRELPRIWEVLDATGGADDTLVIVTSDHGENLGEADERGRRRMGHEASVSEAVLHVPLVLAHPALEGRRIAEPVSLKDLYGLVLDGSTGLIESGGETIPGLLPFEEVVESQYPATGGQKFFEKFPDVPDELLRHRVAEHSVVAYDERWKVIAESTGDRWAGDEGDERPYSTAPELLRDAVQDHLAELRRREAGPDLSDDEVAQLEALGYL